MVVVSRVWGRGQRKVKDAEDAWVRRHIAFVTGGMEIITDHW
jgi:hypothetical protein